jgi:hypothetical protein
MIAHLLQFIADLKGWERLVLAAALATLMLTIFRRLTFREPQAEQRSRSATLGTGTSPGRCR